MSYASKILPALLGATLSLGVVGCKEHGKIPGTEIPDTGDNREILKVLELYRTAFVRLDAAAVLSTAHPTYYDEAGTDDPSDDVVYEELGPVLRTRTSQLESVRFTIDYLRIYVNKDRAVVDVWIDASFQLKPILDPDTGDPRLAPRYARKQDYAQFELLRDGASWRITRGM